MKKMGYVKKIKITDNLMEQIEAITQCGSPDVSIFIEEEVETKGNKQPKLIECLDNLETGDTLIVWRYDIVARSIANLDEILEHIEGKGGCFVSIIEEYDSNSKNAGIYRKAVRDLAILEKNIWTERSITGLMAARAKGLNLGRSKKLTKEEQDELKRFYEQRVPLKEIEERFGISKPTIYRYLRNEFAN